MVWNLYQHLMVGKCMAKFMTYNTDIIYDLTRLLRNRHNIQPAIIGQCHMMRSHDNKLFHQLFIPHPFPDSFRGKHCSYWVQRCSILLTLWLSTFPSMEQVNVCFCSMDAIYKKSVFRFMDTTIASLSLFVVIVFSKCFRAGFWVLSTLKYRVKGGTNLCNL